VGRTGTGSPVGVLKSDRNRPSWSFAGGAIFAFFRQGVLDLASLRYYKRRGLEFSYRFGARAYNPGASLLGRFTTDTK